MRRDGSTQYFYGREADAGHRGGRRFGVDVVSMMSVSVLHTDYWAEEGRPRCCISEEGRDWLVRHARRGGGGPSGRSACPEGPGNGLKRDRKLRNPRKTRKMVKKSGDLAGKREISGPKTPSVRFSRQERLVCQEALGIADASWRPSRPLREPKNGLKMAKNSENSLNSRKSVAAR